MVPWGLSNLALHEGMEKSKRGATLAFANPGSSRQGAIPTIVE